MIMYLQVVQLEVDKITTNYYVYVANNLNKEPSLFRH